MSGEVRKRATLNALREAGIVGPEFVLRGNNDMADPEIIIQMGRVRRRLLRSRYRDRRRNRYGVSGNIYWPTARRKPA